MKTVTLASLVAFVSAYVTLYGISYGWPDEVTKACALVAATASLLAVMVGLFRNPEQQHSRAWRELLRRMETLHPLHWKENEQEVGDKWAALIEGDSPYRKNLQDAGNE